MLTTCNVCSFFISNVLVVASLMVSLYFQSTMALSYLDRQTIASNQIYLIGSLTAIEWIAQLGLLTVIPLYMLYWLENGLLNATIKMASSFARLSPVFFLFGIQTKVRAAGAESRVGCAATPPQQHSPFTTAAALR